MADSILGGISQEATQQELLSTAVLLLASILEKLPRVDASDRILTNGSEVASPVTVTTVASVTNVANQTAIGGRDAANIAFAMANIGAAHIYNNIQVTA